MNNKKVIIIGAGISGMVLALFLHKEGYKVDIIEKRDLYKDVAEEGRSINFTLTGRGLLILKRLDLDKKILSHSVSLQGRLVHLTDLDSLTFSYGSRPEQTIYAVRRADMLHELFNEVQKKKNIHVYTNTSLQEIDANQGSCIVQNLINNKRMKLSGDFMVGADGVFSVTRKFMMEKHFSSFSQHVFEWGYIEANLSAEDAKYLRFNAHYLHTWPQKGGLLIGIPNRDGSFSMLYTSALMNTEISTFEVPFSLAYPAIAAQSSILTAAFNKSAINKLISLQAGNWTFSNKIILIGDACHAVYPFYGQGMNAAIEDAFLLTSALKNNEKISEAFSYFESARQKSVAGLKRLSEKHFHTLNNTQNQIHSYARETVNLALTRLIPAFWKHEYELVAHTELSYESIIKVMDKQNKLRHLLGISVCEWMMTAYLHLRRFLGQLHRF